MAHVELSLSNLLGPGPDASGSPAYLGGSLSLWTSTVAYASEPCLVLDCGGNIAAASPGCAELLSIDPAAAVGRRLVSEVLRLLDFSPVPGPLPDWEAERIPSLLAINSGALARSLLRFAGPDGTPTTVDAVSVPLRDDDEVVGSLTFFAPVGRPAARHRRGHHRESD